MGKTSVILLVLCTPVCQCLQGAVSPRLAEIDRTGDEGKPLPLRAQVNLGTLRISPMGLGTLNLPLNRETDDETTSVIQTACNMGINFVDTAEAYGFGKSESLTANSCRAVGLEIGGWELDDEKYGSAGINKKMAVATKFAPVPWRLDGRSVVKACKASASRLGVDRIPLYQIHFPDLIQPFKAFGVENRKDELYWDGLAECYLSGMAENVGVSNYGPEMILRAQEALSKRGVPLASNQINLSLLRYRSSEATLRTCDDLGIRVLSYFPLANGVLAGKYSENPPSFPKSLTMNKYIENTSLLLAVLRSISQERGKTIAQVSINWVMMKGAVPIPGARTSSMAEDNFGAKGWALSSEEVERLDTAAAKVMEFSSGGFDLI